MYRPLAFLAALVLLAFTGTGRADPACGSDASSDPVEAMGKEVWLDGYCRSFLPCRLVLEQFHGCQAAENFLSGLGAEQGTSLTESQVEDALVRSTGRTSGLSSCVASFDAQACKRYLGSDGQTSSEPATVAAGSAAEAARKPMSRDAAVLARQRIRDMDANAHTAFGMIERDCKAGAENCRNTLEQMVDPVVREADELNANPEYLAQLPAYSPGSVEYAGRLGWTRQNGQWAFGGTRAASTTLGDYLLSLDECRRLRERLDQEIGANPAREPVELSLFEAECLPQMPDARAGVAGWRQGFKDEPAQAAAAEAPLPTADDKTGTTQLAAASVALSDWNEEAVAEESGVRRQIARRFDLPGGCYLYVYTFEDDEDFKPEVSWSGPCEAGEPVNGTGDFSFGGDIPYGDDYKAARVVNGRLEGGPYLDVSEQSWHLHSYAGGCQVREEYLGRTWDSMLKEEETYRSWAELGGGDKDPTGRDFKGRITGLYILNRTYQGVKYYRHPSESPGEQDTLQADRHCVAAFAKLH